MACDKPRSHAVIVGGSSGIGRALALHFSESCNVSVLARRTEVLDEFLNKPNILRVTADATSTEGLSEAIHSCVERFGKVDKLVYCAGQQVIKPHRMMSSADFDVLYEVNLRGALFASKLFCSNKVSEKSGVFCVISSIASLRPEPGIVGYSAMKSAVDNMIAGLGKECAPRRFVGVSPGWLDTEMTRKQAIYNDQFRESLANRTPLGLTNVSDIVFAVDFLTGERASSITGQVLCVDSGSSL
jgi:NAD(P)-dependent dehydrogenase (short-subunit alcohol dehydrogenase family)